VQVDRRAGAEDADGAALRAVRIPARSAVGRLRLEPPGAAGGPALARVERIHEGQRCRERRAGWEIRGRRGQRRRSRGQRSELRCGRQGQGLVERERIDGDRPAERVDAQGMRPIRQAGHRRARSEHAVRRRAVDFLQEDAVDLDPEATQRWMLHVDDLGAGALEEHAQRIAWAAAAEDVAPTARHAGVVGGPFPGPRHGRAVRLDYLGAPGRDRRGRRQRGRRRGYGCRSGGHSGQGGRWDWRVGRCGRRRWLVSR